jgi:hypothetical protein
MGDFGIKINNTFLDLYPNTSFSYVLNSPFYLGGELGDALAGSLIFSVKVPLTPTNNTLLRFPGVIDNAWVWLEKQDCSVYAEGVSVWFGKLDVVAPSTEREAYIRITINSVAALQTLKMNELDLGTFNALQGTTGTDWANATVANPDAHNFLFPSVWNPNFWGRQTTPTFQVAEMQNHYLNGSGRGGAGFGSTEPSPYPSLTPMPKLDFVVRKIFENIGFTCNNRFQNTHELKRLLVYTNASLNKQDALQSTATAYPLSRGLSSTTAAIFLRHLCRKFSIGAFFDTQSQSVDLIPFNQAVKAGAVNDWTNKQLYGYELTQNIDYPKILADKLTDTINPDKLKELPVFDEYPADFDGIEGIYRYDGQTFYHKNLVQTSINPNISPVRQLSRARIADEIDLKKTSGSRYENELGTLILSRHSNIFGQIVEYPSLLQRGKDGSEAVTSDNNTADRLVFYRGLSKSGHPFAASEIRYLEGQNIKVNSASTPDYDAQYSLDWMGEKGIYNRFWTENHQLVANGKLLKTRIFLSIAELKRFSFKDKVRLGNQEGFVKSIAGVLNRQGLQPADVSIVTLT